MPPRNCQRSRACISVSLLIGRCTRKSKPFRSKAAMWACKSGYFGFSMFPPAVPRRTGVEPRPSSAKTTAGFLEKAKVDRGQTAINNTDSKEARLATHNLTHLPSHQVAFVELGWADRKSVV